jgi:hypothetical protein
VSLREIFCSTFSGSTETSIAGWKGAGPPGPIGEGAGSSPESFFTVFLLAV